MNTTAAAPLDIPDWVLATAHRLRFFQANFANDSRESRDAFLEEELRRLLEPVPAAKRQEYLAALAEKFPTWEDLAATALDTAATAKAQTTEEIWRLFLQTLPRFTPEQRAAITQRLAEEGLVKIATDSLSPETMGDVAEKLKFTAADKIDPARLGKVFAALAEFAAMSDQLVWNVWKSLAPKSTLRRDGSAGDLRTAVRRSVTGDPEVSATQIARQLERLRQLTAALIASLAPAAKTFARQHNSRYAPDAVRELVKLEGGTSLFGNTDARRWKKYSELAQGISGDSIQTALIASVTQYAEDLMHGKDN
ncbi:MAG: hypothetical protein LBS59_02825 [Puniceicoccales bacterium]|jgi:hypothetical protein|nr:hypothetical protein [Puniceicoccales bacterium]